MGDFIMRYSLRFLAYFNCCLQFSKNQRGKLFRMINSLPTVYEIIIETYQKTSLSKSENIYREELDSCAMCQKVYNPGEFWIQCENCENWYHGKCACIAPLKAER